MITARSASLRDPTIGETPPALRRPRRRSGEVQTLILEAARRTFAEKGYARTTTREIAARAGVAEPLLFRKFESKPKLFAEAVLHPMAQFIRDWMGEMPTSLSPETIEQAQRGFLERLYTIASQQRGLVLTFFATSVFEPEVLEAGGAAVSIQEALDDLARFTERQLIDSGVDLDGFNVPIASRSVIGMVLAMALFGDWLLPPGRRRPTRTALLDELTRQVLYGGFNQRPRLRRRRRG
ncbi:MAG: TetR/AcrR family transcriptional regulator [Candidatus Binatia bacterium]